MRHLPILGGSQLSYQRTPSAFENRIRDSLLRHRDEDPIPLSFELSITHLMDAKGCSLLTQDLKASCSSWECESATPELGTLLPHCGGLYMFVWHPQLVLARMTGNSECEHDQRYVLYVGKASGGQDATIRDRYQSEYKQFVCQDPEQLWNKGLTAGRRDRLKKYLCLWPLEFWYTEAKVLSSIDNLERRLIKMLSPPLNCQRKPRYKFAKPKSAFRK